MGIEKGFMVKNKNTGEAFDLLYLGKSACSEELAQGIINISNPSSKAKYGYGKITKNAIDTVLAKLELLYEFIRKYSDKVLYRTGEVGLEQVEIKKKDREVIENLIGHIDSNLTEFDLWNLFRIAEMLRVYSRVNYLSLSEDNPGELFFFYC